MLNYKYKQFTHSRGSSVVRKVVVTGVFLPHDEGNLVIATVNHLASPFGMVLHAALRNRLANQAN